jgi:glycosyltransferase involved in cell wall biosynthesis
LSGLAALGHRITILSCEKPDRLKAEKAAVEQLCREAHLTWEPTLYHARPPVLSSAYDTAMLARRAAVLHRQRNFEIVHCRSYIPAIVGMHLKRRYGLKLVFDMRGFWPEEKVESGSWPQRNPLFRAVYDYFKREEANCLSQAETVVSLTNAGRDELLKRPELRGEDARIAVIPTCVDFGHFDLATPSRRRRAREALGIAADSPVLGYLGSVGGQNYMLDEMLDFFRAYRERRPGAKFLFVTQADPKIVMEAAARKAVPADELIIRAADRDEVPLFTSAADHGVAFKRSSFSALACSPTKLGEMMALGIPIAANAGVGDVTSILEEADGVVVQQFDPESLAKASDELTATKAAPKTLRDKARRLFDLQHGVRAYDRIYRTIVS